MLNNQSTSVLSVAQNNTNSQIEVNTMTNQVQLFDNANLVSVRDGKCFCTSLMIAEKFEKEHKNVLRDIQNLTASLDQDFTKLNFELSDYKDPTGRTLPMYNLTRDGFSLLVMGFTGEKALQWKVAA